MMWLNQHEVLGAFLLVVLEVVGEGQVGLGGVAAGRRPRDGVREDASPLDLDQGLG
jgi:hypothetical protein